MTDDWRYTDETMRYRNAVLMHLLENYGGDSVDGVPLHSPRSLYACAQDWISGGKRTLEGLDDFYINNY